MSAVLDKCSCCQKRYPVIVSYIRGPKAKLNVTWKQGRGVKVAWPDTWKEPHPDGQKGELFACPDCDDTNAWPRSQPKPKSRFGL